MNRGTILAAGISALLVLGVIGGFLALDKTTLHWYSNSEDRPTATAIPPRLQPSFFESDVTRLAQVQVANQGQFPGDTRWVRCTNASFRRGNQLWIVTCEFRLERDDTLPTATRTYTFNDRTGQVVFQ